MSVLGNIGPTELIVIGIVLVILFGSKRITEVAGTLGKTTKEYKKAKAEYNKAITGVEDELKVEKKINNIKEVKKDA